MFVCPLLLLLQEEEEEEEEQQQLGHDEEDDDEAMHDADDAGPHMSYAADDGEPAADIPHKPAMTGVRGGAAPAAEVLWMCSAQLWQKATKMYSSSSSSNSGYNSCKDACRQCKEHKISMSCSTCHLTAGTGSDIRVLVCKLLPVQLVALHSRMPSLQRECGLDAAVASFS
jgi:hypothetical protein